MGKDTQLGAVKLSSAIREKIRIGLWAVEFDEGKEPRLYSDDTMLGILGLEAPSSPESFYRLWLEHIDKASFELIEAAARNIVSNEMNEVRYTWHRQDGRTIVLRGAGFHNQNYSSGLRLEGTIQDVSDMLHFDIREKETSDYIKNVYAKEYDAVFIWTLSDGHFNVISSKSGLDLKTGGISKFGDSMRYYADTFIHPDDASSLIEWIYDSKATKEKLDIGKSITLKYRSRSEGEYRWNEAKFNRINDDEVLAGFKDCNDKVVSDLAISRLLDKYDALYVLDLNSGIINPVRLSRVTPLGVFSGSVPYSQIAMRFAESVSPEYRQGWFELSDVDYLKRYLAVEDHREYIYELPVAKQVMRRVSYDVIERSDGIPSKVFLSFLGIDDLSAKTIMLQRSILEQSIFMGYFLGSYWSAYYVNSNTHEAKVYKRSSEWFSDAQDVDDFFEEIRKGIDVSASPDDREELSRILTPEFLREELKINRIFTYRFKDIQNGYVTHLRLEAVMGADDDHFAIGFKDITAEVKAQQDREKKLEDALEMAQNANNAKTVFLNSMSHDVRTPMNAIIGYTSLAKKYIDNRDKVLAYLNKIGAAGNNLLELVNQVLDMSRIESGKVVLEDSPVDIVEKTCEMAEIFTPSAQAKNITITASASSVKDRLAFADCGRVNQLIMNIIGNAVKYTPEGGHIRYSASQLPCDRQGFATYVFTVEDDGIGMSEEYLSRIFEPFSRENTSTVSKIQGTGLGMAIVKRLVDLMGGSIDIGSEKGKGTKISVTLTLRLQEKQETELKRSDFEDNFTVLRGKRVLLVEDNEMNREIATMLLEEQEIIVETADDGDVAVAMVQDVARKEDWQYYDAILMDIQMPRMNGYEASMAIRAIPCPRGVHIPIIAMTANAFLEDRLLAADAGMDAHVAKPVDVNILWETLARLV